MRVTTPLLLYSDDLIFVSESASGLQKQLDALASFCEQRQVTFNLSKTEVVVFKTRPSDAIMMCVTLCSEMQLWIGWRATSIGFALDQTAGKDSWQHCLGKVLHGSVRTAAVFSQFWHCICCREG